MEDTGRRLLAALGVDADSEHVYRLLLASPGASLSELRVASGIGVQRLRRVLARLEHKAMVTQRTGRPSRYHPAPPGLVVEALISAREGELKQARLEVRQLTSVLTESPSAQPRVTDVVEILTSPAAVTERYLQLQLATRSRLEVFTRLPFAQSAPEEHEPVEATLGSRDVVIRAIYDAETLCYPGILDHVRRMAAIGEQARAVSRLPLKLALFDRRSALVPMTQLGPEGTVSAGIVVHQSLLLDALTDLFEIYWQRATPLRADGVAVPARRRAADEESVLMLLAAGLKDEAIARQLSVSTYTVRRRIGVLTERLGATNRFQVGLALGRQGWPPVSS